MKPERKRAPGGAPGLSLARRNSSTPNHTTPTLRNASARALERELSIIVMAAHRMAAGYGLAWSDYDRLHEAHQHTIRVLAALRGGEALQ